MHFLFWPWRKDGGRFPSRNSPIFSGTLHVRSWHLDLPSAATSTANLFSPMDPAHLPPSRPRACCLVKPCCLGIATGAASAEIFLKALPVCFTVRVVRGACDAVGGGARGNAFPRGPRVARGGEAAAAADARRRRRGFHRRGAADARRGARGPCHARTALQNLTGTPARTELEVVAHVARLGGAAALRFEGRGVGLEEGARRVGPAPFEERH